VRSFGRWALGILGIWPSSFGENRLPTVHIKSEMSHWEIGKAYDLGPNKNWNVPKEHSQFPFSKGRLRLGGQLLKERGMAKGTQRDRCRALPLVAQNA
jgi:hypothetical protein